MTLLGRLRGGLSRTAAQLGRRVDDLLGASAGARGSGPDDVAVDDTFEALEALLLQADVGVVATERIIAKLKGTDTNGDLRQALKTAIREILDGADRGTDPAPPLRVVLVVGVNGTGKTTTVGKLAHLLAAEGRRPLVCAADTFRAAAVEQLTVWADRAQVDVIRANPGADPAAVVFDAIKAGRAREKDVLVVDTAGRLHTRVNLMAELEKIRRVVAREVEGGPHDVLLVLDATVGQNGLAQARQFLESAVVTGIVLTKLDGTAKGGIAIAVAEELKIPIRYVGVGEGLSDLLPFSAEEYVEGLFARGT